MLFKAKSPSIVRIKRDIITVSESTMVCVDINSN